MRRFFFAPKDSIAPEMASEIGRNTKTEKTKMWRNVEKTIKRQSRRFMVVATH